LTLTATYFHTTFSDRIELPPVSSFGAYLGDPTLASFLIRDPPLAQVIADFAKPGFLDTTGLGPQGVGAIFDSRVANISATKESGIDFGIEYDLNTDYGQFLLSLNGTHLFEFEYQALTTLPTTRLLDTFAQPTSWRSRGSITWQKSGFVLSTAVNYIGAYQNSLLTLSGGIAPWTTVDLFAAYKTEDRFEGRWGRHITLALSIQNVANRQPPFVTIPSSDLLPGQGGIPFDPTNASPVGRFISLQLTKGW
jgi:hypothetical protein